MPSTSSAFPLLPVLIVDDELPVAQGLQIALKTGGIVNIQVCTDSLEAARWLVEREFEMLVVDLTMPNLTGDQLLDIVMRDHPDMPVIVVTANDELDTAVKCMKAGAFDYMVKPVARERLVTGVRRAIEMRTLRRENSRLKQHVLNNALEHPDVFAEFDTSNPSMRQLFQYMEAISISPDPVLITGETGTGKEIAAGCLHRLSGRTGSFVCVNVAGLDEQAFSDTLFGHRKGAFTNALEARIGMVERAAGGTLFLDEIGDLAPPLQTKLLRLLQEREYLPLGADLPRKSDARVVVATNRSVQELKLSTDFRRDLYFRLCHHHVHLPALRERREDIPALVKRFLNEAAKTLGRPAPACPPSLMEDVGDYAFPGNVRELRAMIFDAVSSHKTETLPRDYFRQWLGRGATDPAMAAHGWSLPVESGTLPSLKDAQEWLVQEAVRRAAGNQAIAARMLGISRQALNKRLNREKPDG